DLPRRAGADPGGVSGGTRRSLPVEERIMFARMAMVALGVACAAAQSAYGQNFEKPAITLAVGGKTLVAFLPLTIAERLGLFEKEGLKVEIHDFQGGSRALQSLVGGSADVVCGSYEH